MRIKDIDWRDHVDMTRPGFKGKTSDEIRLLLSPISQQSVMFEILLDRFESVISNAIKKIENL